LPLIIFYIGFCKLSSLQVYINSKRHFFNRKYLIFYTYHQNEALTRSPPTSHQITFYFPRIWNISEFLVFIHLVSHKVWIITLKVPFIHHSVMSIPSRKGCNNSNFIHKKYLQFGNATHQILCIMDFKNDAMHLH